ncbi:MAG TPA: signal recognition particle protein [Chloroflexota bacterium]|nr:signal recognition particle protein [Chloroflexota bacterium]
MFDTLTDRLTSVFSGLRSKGALTERDVDEAMREVRMSLLEADVNFRVVKDFVARVKERCVGAEVLQSLTPAQQVVKIVHEELAALLGSPSPLNLGGQPPFVIMLAGLQGSGKTTTAAKLGLLLRKQKHVPLLVAADTYRPAAVDQLIALGKQLDIATYNEGTKAKPQQIAANGLRQARETGKTVVILDTAGRLHIDQPLMEELRDIERLTKPDEVLLVADAMTGQDAVRAAEEFHRNVDITGLVLTKIDGDARGGAALSIRAVTGVPIKFLGTSEKPDGLEAFHPDRLVDRILGMGDVMSLIEKAQESFDEEQAKSLQKKMRTATFDLEDFLNQVQSLKKMGSLTGILEMIPGMRGTLKGAGGIPDLDGKEFKRIEAMITSMTKEERHNPQMINGSRRRRIARGSGTSIQDVNQLLNQFKDMQKMMKSMMTGKKRIPKAMRGLMG